MRYPLTTPQQNIWNIKKYYENTSISNVSGMMRFVSVYDYEALNNAVNALIENSDAFRLRFFEESGQPYQTVIPYERENITEHDMRGKTPAEIDSFFSNLAQQPFSPEQSKLYHFAVVRLDDGQCGIFLCACHLICDAWSMSVMAKEVLRYYQQELSDGATQNSMPSYLDAVASEQQYLSSPQYEKDKAYWDATFAEKPQLCRVNDVKENRGSTTTRYTHELDGDFCREIETCCKEKNITPVVLFETALFAYLHRTNEFASPVTIGTLVLNRSTITEKKTIGTFVSTMPLSVPVDETAGLSELCQTVKQKHMEAFRHQKYPISHILQTLREKDSDASNLRDVMVSYQNARIDGLGVDVSVTWYSNGHSEVPLYVHIEDMGNTGGYKLHFDFQTAVLSMSETAMLCDRLRHILRQTIDNGAVKVCDIQIVAFPEYQRVIHDFNNTGIGYTSDKCVHQLFEEQVTKIPDKVAVVACDKSLTYGELNEHANRIAHNLIKMGIKANDFVALQLPRESYLLSAIMGVLKSGAAYLPIDPKYPKDRIDYILKDSGAEIFITSDNIEQFINGEKSDNPVVEVCGNNLCYCIYTSGSTGLPKGMMLEHGQLVNFCLLNNEEYLDLLLQTEVSAFINSISFDFSVAEIYPLLINSKTLVLIDGETKQIPNLVNKTIYKNGVELIQTTPSLIDLLAKADNAVSAFSQLKTIVFCGEALPETLCSNLKTLNPAIQIFNYYGPTETTVWSTGTFIKSHTDITIGRPIANTQIYILDKNLQPLPIGASGELCISGDGVGRGYLNRPELTAEKFVPNPFIKGKRMYKTGDLARWREDGQLEYIGRMDNQVKIRGLRIELGEIEAAIMRFDGLKQAAVVDRKDETGRQYICAYYVSDGDIDEKALRAELAKTLPRYMFPHFFTRLETFPTTPSGKTDRKAFPSPDFTQSYSNAEYIAPTTEQEKELIRVLEVVLGVSPVGMGDDFFDLGGDSLKAIEFVAKAHDEGIYFALQNLFDYPTPAALLTFLESEEKARVNYTAADFEKFNTILHRNQIDETFFPVKTDMGNLFLTGATGFLGAHILDAYLKNSTGTAYCLVRGNSDVDARERLADILTFYFGDTYTNDNRIFAIRGDITSAITMDADVHTVIHSAASVKHYGSYQYFYDMNVVGTKNVIDFTKQKNARLIHISTISVSGDGFVDDFSGHRFKERTCFSEQNLFIDQPFDNVYARSKYEAEVEVLNAILDGLKANIVRVGNLTNRHSDAKFQINHIENAFVKRVKAVLEFGLFPDYLLPYRAEFSPIDLTADGIIKIAQHFNESYSMFHVNNNKPLYFDEMLEMLKTVNVNMKLVDAVTFTQALFDIARQTGTEHIYEALMNDMDSDNQLAYDGNINIENAFTAWYLNRLGFEWPEVDAGYFTRYVEYFRKIGYLGV